MKNMDLTRREIGSLGEDLVKKYLEEKGFYITRGFGSSPDLKLYRTEPNNNRSKVSNYFRVEVKTTLKQKFVHLPRESQRKANDLLAQVKLLEVLYNGVGFKIRFKPLSREGKRLMEKLPTKWEVGEFG